MNMDKSGDNYITGLYLKKVKQKKGRVFYTSLKKNVYFYPDELYCPAIKNADLSVAIKDHQYLCDSI